MGKNVYIVSNYGRQYTSMFTKRGWTVVEDMEKADLVQFVGGEDVMPSLYEHHAHPTTHYNIARDRKEKLIYLLALKNKLPIAGICRGGQFVNVMNGGSMWQNVGGHCGEHMAFYTDMKMKSAIRVTSTHHQMMIPVNNNDDYMLLMVAEEGGTREKCTPLDAPFRIVTLAGLSGDVEALYYHKTKSLCFQPHPEFDGEEKLAGVYFQFIDFMFLM